MTSRTIPIGLATRIRFKNNLKSSLVKWLALAFGCMSGISLGGQSQGPEHPPTPSLEQKLREVRYDLHVDPDNHLAGTGASILASAVADANYVLIGEDHLTREIPEFTAAVCSMMGPTFSTMVIEASPEVAAFVSSSLGKPDRLARMTALLRRFPDSVAFENVRQENDLVNYCAQASHNAAFQVWGLDQPFIGSAGWLLEQVLATHPGPRATALLNQLKKEEEQDAAQALKSGDPSQLFLISVSDSKLVGAAEGLRAEGTPRANALMQELIESREIYRKNLSGDATASNEQRAHLLKRNFRRDEQAAQGRERKMLIKFGDSHLYKGFNDIHQRDLGNYVAEIADAKGTTSLHICVLGAEGTHLFYGGYNRPGKTASFRLGEDDSYPWLKPAIANRVPDSLTLYDLRKLRFQKIESVSPEMERLIYGYDLLVILPRLTPADPL